MKTTIILVNGSKWAGEDPEGIDELLAVLGREPLDPTHEAYGNFSRAFKDCEWPDGAPDYATEEMWMFDGNFLRVSHAFLIHTDDDEVIEKLRRAIWQNKQREDYRTARLEAYPLIKRWLAVGRGNPWISKADDPPLTEMSFAPCCDAEDLADKIREGNWCLGQGFFCDDLCLINQVDGGDEWLVVKRSVAFESFTCRAFDRDELIETFKKFIAAKDVRCCKRANY